MSSLLSFFLLVGVGGLAHAGDLVDGRNLNPAAPKIVADSVHPGTVLVMGEIHDNREHHHNQVLMLQNLGARGIPVSVGLEFFERQHQSLVDQFVAGSLDEATFLGRIGWGGTPFDFYRQQALFPARHSGFTVALNASRALTSKIARKGLAGLSPEEKALLPPDFALGTDLYYERFKETMAGHVPPDATDRYFEAQSVWDDTMAHTAAEFIASHPDQVLVILVGDFHAAYGGGLPARLAARGVPKVHVISQVNIKGLGPDEKLELIQPHPKWGIRGDYVWLADQ